MEEITVEINNEDAKFIKEKDIDFDDVVSRAISMSKREWRENNPQPAVPESLLNRIEQIHNKAKSDSMGLESFREGLPRARVSVGAKIVENGYEVNIFINNLDNIPDGSFDKKLRDSGEFLSKIGKQIEDRLSQINDSKEEFIFERYEIVEDKFKVSSKYKINVHFN